MTMTVKLEIDTSQQGLRMVLKDWEEETLKVFWDDPQKEYTSKLVWDRVNQRLRPGSISRASIINFLEDMVEMGVLGKRETTGKGGYRGIYSSKMGESGFKRFIAETALEVLMSNFPEETKQVCALFQ
jgi:predicted transcriptional regulator